MKLKQEETDESIIEGNVIAAGTGISKPTNYNYISEFHWKEDLTFFFILQNEIMWFFDLPFWFWLILS